ncbi:hypothetical protein GCM10010446_61640 [Streptomyces enissocaesilis]|uniref:Transposase n=1 Tax=Streptomyces enissocaesilis TaxID=332589 RepID=A0ABN3XLY9_9ACTN
MLHKVLAWSWDSAPDRPAGGAWSGGNRPGSSIGCTRSCSPSCAADELDWSRACVNGSPSARKKGDVGTGPSPVGRQKTGSEHHLICHRPGTPLKAITTAASVNEGAQTLALVATSRPSRTSPAHPRRHPEALFGDKSYDSEPDRKELPKGRLLSVISGKKRPTSSA